MVGPAVLGIVYPQVGKLAGVLGAFGAFLVIYILPTVTMLKHKRTMIHNPALVEALREGNFILQPKYGDEIIGNNENEKLVAPMSPKIGIMNDVTSSFDDSSPSEHSSILVKRKRGRKGTS